jgi:hypothetical protein
VAPNASRFCTSLSTHVTEGLGLLQYLHRHAI